MKSLLDLIKKIKKTVRPLEPAMERAYLRHQLEVISGPLKFGVFIGSFILWMVIYWVAKYHPSSPPQWPYALVVQAYLIFCFFALYSTGTLRWIAVVLTPVIPSIVAYVLTRHTIVSLETTETMSQGYQFVILLVIVFYAFETVSVSLAVASGLITSFIIYTGRLNNAALSSNHSIVLLAHLIIANLTGVVMCFHGCLTSRLQFKYARTAERDREILDSLVQRVFPEIIGKELRTKGSNLARHYQNVTVIMADIANFTRITSSTDPKQLVTILHELFHRFDRLADQHGVEKIKTIGDAYMASSGCPVAAKDHTVRIAHFAIQLLSLMESFNKTFKTDLKIRIGIHTGPVIGGVISGKRISFDIWGETVNLTSRLQNVAEPGEIIVSDETSRALRGKFVMTDYRTVELKGLGATPVARLVGSNENNPFTGGLGRADSQMEVSELPFLSQH